MSQRAHGVACRVCEGRPYPGGEFWTPGLSHFFPLAIVGLPLPLHVLAQSPIQDGIGGNPTIISVGSRACARLCRSAAASIAGVVEFFCCFTLARSRGTTRMRHVDACWPRQQMNAPRAPRAGEKLGSDAAAAAAAWQIM